MKKISVPCLLLVLLCKICGAQPIVVDQKMHHLRNTDEIEWAHFPAKAESKRLEVEFNLAISETHPNLLIFRQEDVKQNWLVHLNEKKIGTLLRDFNHQEHAVKIPEGLLKPAGNKLKIFTESENPDDIRVGDFLLRQIKHIESPDAETWQKNRGYQAVIPNFHSTLNLKCIDAESNTGLPCRFTITNADTGALALLGAESDDNLAVRHGVVYSLDGTASVKIQSGRTYEITASRGFEYSIDRKEITVAQSETAEGEFSIHREVQTLGLVACDPHLHTFEFDRHGDCTLTERLIAIAGEGIELPISTGHDKHIDYTAEAKRIGADKWFTPVIGCEVTTSNGHFNTFPIEPDAAPAEHKLRPWDQVFKNIYATPGVRICILNHGRDLHRGYRPFGPENFDEEKGVFLRGLKLRANAMEVINNGAQICEPMQLVHDWMSLLRSGHKIAAIGSSDSHTVNFTIAGQARTYLKCSDENAGSLDVDSAVDSLAGGESLVSFGLLTRMKIDGEIATVTVTKPGWVDPEIEITLFKNGESVGSQSSQNATFENLQTESGDFLIAVAIGKGITHPFWAYNPPYQATSPKYTPYTMGISAVHHVE